MTNNKSTCKVSYRHALVIHGAYKCTGLRGARTNSFGATLTEQSCHWRFIRQTELTSILHTMQSIHPSLCWLQYTIHTLSINTNQFSKPGWYTKRIMYASLVAKCKSTYDTFIVYKSMLLLRKLNTVTNTNSAVLLK